MQISEALKSIVTQISGNQRVLTETVAQEKNEYLVCVTKTAIKPVPPLKAKRVPVVPEPAELAKIIDHTQLKPEATPRQIRKLCQEAREYHFASVCVNPVYIPLAVAELEGSRVPVCTVVGFPLGSTLTELKALETQIAVAAGAREIDMVIHVGRLKSGDTDNVRKDIEAVVAAAGPGVLVKVILETCLLTDEEIEIGCQLSQQAGAHFVKTSTGFNRAGATAQHIGLMRKTVRNKMGVKAAGGIRDYETALKMVQAGASRIGASASVAIVSGGKN